VGHDIRGARAIPPSLRAKGDPPEAILGLVAEVPRGDQTRPRHSPGPLLFGGGSWRPLSCTILRRSHSTSTAWVLMPNVRSSFGWGIAVIALQLVGCSGMPQLPPLPEAVQLPPPAPAPSSSIERQVHDRVNARRQSIGLPALAWNATVAPLAADHSARMANGTRPFGHDGFEERIASAGATLSISRASENVATNNYPVERVAQQVVDGWISSAGHRRNLEGEFQLTGVGVGRSAAGDYFVTQIYLAQ
jgi:uncharacterized protein YkwD